MLAIAGAMALASAPSGSTAWSLTSCRSGRAKSGFGGARRRAAAAETMFLLHGLALSGVGVVVGLVAAAGLARLMSSVLFGVGPMDPVAYAVAVGVILAAAALASYLPARRAAASIPWKR